MKKKAYLVVLALCTALAFTACGTTTDQKENTKSAAEAQDTTNTDKEDSGSEASDSADSSADKVAFTLHVSRSSTAAPVE